MTHQHRDVDRFYTEQLLDHFGDDDNQETYTQRYFQDGSFFQGPGHPILVVMGGEAPVDTPSVYTCLLRDLR